MIPVSKHAQHQEVYTNILLFGGSFANSVPFLHNDSLASSQIEYLQIGERGGVSGGAIDRNSQKGASRSKEL